MQTVTKTISRNELYQVACHLLFGTLVAVITILALTGCSRRYDDYPAYTPVKMKDYENYGVGRFKTSYLIDQIDEYYRGTNAGPVGVATFVNLDDLYTTSTFGRVLGEQVMSELAMRGFDVVELRHSDALQFLAPDGEFALSRDVGAVRRERDLGGIVVGTYAVSPIRVYVNARLINPSTSMVQAVGSVEMAKTKEIARLLRGGGMPGTLERIPVRHLGLSTYPAAFFGPYNSKFDAEERAYTPPPAPAFNAGRPSMKAPAKQMPDTTKPLMLTE